MARGAARSGPLPSGLMSVMSLRDSLFLLSHDDAGKLLLSEATIGAGLAGAALIDLLLNRRAAVVDGRLELVERTPTGDDEADATLAAIDANTAPCGPRAWVSWISHGAYRRIAGLLVADGTLRRVTVRRLGLVPVTRYVPTDPAGLVRVRARIRYAMHGVERPDAATGALCGLVRVLRLEPNLLLSMPRSDVASALEKATVTDDAAVRRVITAVETVITAAIYP